MNKCLWKDVKSASSIKKKNNKIKITIMKNKLLLIAVLFVSTATFAQKKNVTSAIMSYRKGKLIKAEGYINKAAKHESTKESAKTWVNRALIYAALSTSKDEKFVEYAKGKDFVAEVMTSIENTKKFDKKGKYKREIVKIASPMYGNALDNGIKMYNAKEYAKALKFFTSSQKLADFLSITDSAGAFNGALSAQNSGNDLVAIKNYERCVEIGYGGVNTYLNLNTLYVKTKQTDKAAKLMAAAKEKYPNDPNVILSETKHYLETKQPEKALASIDAALANDPNNFAMQYAAGMVYNQMEQYKKSKLAYLKALEIKPDSYNALYNLSMVYNNVAVVLNDKMNDLPLSKQKEYEEAKKSRDKELNESLPYLEKAYAVEKDASLKRVLNKAYQILGMNDKVIK